MYVQALKPCKFVSRLNEGASTDICERARALEDPLNRVCRPTLGSVLCGILNKICSDLGISIEST